MRGIIIFLASALEWRIKLPYLIDTHAHLNSEEYSCSLDSIIEKASLAGVKKIISVGCDAESSERNIAIASMRRGSIYATYGYHPHDAAKFDERYAKDLERHVKAKNICAVGEIGLDYYRDISPRDLQKECFLRQVAIAAKYDYPVIVHIRDAFDDFRELCRNIDFRGVIHCYCGGIEFTKWALEKGFHISFTASITYPLKNLYKASKEQGKPIYRLLEDASFKDMIPDFHRELFSLIPPERIMVETDCPYLSPQSIRGKLNEPANVVAVAECVAGLAGIDYDEFCAITSANAERFFSI